MTSATEQLRKELGAAVALAQPGPPAANQLCVTCVDLLGVDSAAISMVYDGSPHGTLAAEWASQPLLDLMGGGPTEGADRGDTDDESNQTNGPRRS